MELYSLIYQLVRDNDCVIIPDFGGFVANCFSAEVDFAKQEFCPPSRKVAFNENLSVSDGLLVSYMAKANNLSWDEANEQVKDFVLQINRQLAVNQTVTFDGIGEFSRKTGTLVFVPEVSNFLDDAFGLPTFNFPLLQASKPKINPTIIKAPKSTSKSGKSKFVAWTLSSAAVVTAALCVSLYMGWFGNFMNNSETTATNTAGFVPTTQIVETEETQDAVVEEETVDFTEVQEMAEAQPEIVEEVVEVAQVEEVAEETKVETEVASEKNVHIIAGCFSELSNAENVCNSLKELGLESQILPLHKGLYRVSAKSFETVKEASAELPTLREITGNKALWIL
ncbi:MAG: hypothetical protein HUK15_08765 [Bacteroidales bacterium]|nr:hypothetical protein [Bacteroidales bacterium]